MKLTRHYNPGVYFSPGSGGALDLVPPPLLDFFEKCPPPLWILGCHWPPHFLAGSGGGSAPPPLEKP